MTLKDFAVLLGTCALVCPNAAAARDQAKEQVRVRKITFDYAACVVRKHHAAASETILATASNRDILGRFPQIIDPDCLGSAAGLGVDMRFPADTYKYALADALVNVDLVTANIISFDDRLALAQPVSAQSYAPLLARTKSDSKRKALQYDYEKQNALAWISRYGECVARQDPVNARYWLLTRPDTPEEASRIKAMQPAFAACLDAQAMRFNRIIMRGTVAINYYRLAMATVVPGAGSTR